MCYDARAMTGLVVQCASNKRSFVTRHIGPGPDEQARMPRGNAFIWTVVAQGKDGSTIGAGQATFKVR